MSEAEAEVLDSGSNTTADVDMTVAPEDRIDDWEGNEIADNETDDWDRRETVLKETSGKS